MPVPKGTKFRVVTRHGQRVRIAIHDGKVIETKTLTPKRRGK